MADLYTGYLDNSFAVLGALFIFIFAVVFVIFQKKRANRNYRNFISSIKNYAHEQADLNVVRQLLNKAESKPEIPKVFSAYKTVDKSYSVYSAFFSQGGLDYKATECFVLLVDTNLSFPFFYVYTSDFDAYDSKSMEAFEIPVGDAKYKIVAQKGATNEIYRIIENVPDVAVLNFVAQKSGINIEFSGNRIYIWNYYNDRRNIKIGEFDSILLIKDLAIDYFAPKLAKLKRDFDYIKEAFANK